MKVALVSSGLVSIPSSTGGAVEEYVFQLARHLTKLGVKPYIIDSTEKEGSNIFENANGIPIIKIPIKISSHIPKRNIVKEFLFGLSSREILRKIDADIVHLNTAWAGLATAIRISGGKVNEPKLVYTCHNPLWPEKRVHLKERIVRLVEGFTMRQANAVISLNKTMHEAIVKNTGINPSKIYTVPNGVDIYFYHPGIKDKFILKKLGIEPERYILFVGRVTPVKGVHYLLKAFEWILKRGSGSDMRLVIAGPLSGEFGSQGISTYAKFLKEYARKKLSHRVIFTGSLNKEDIRSLYSNSYTFVLPSLVEAFGMVLLEAMASGVPVIGSTAGGIKDVIRDGVYGFLFKRGNWMDLAKKLEILIEDGNLRNRMSKKAREAAVEKYSWDIIATRLSDVYKRTLS